MISLVCISLARGPSRVTLGKSHLPACRPGSSAAGWVHLRAGEVIVLDGRTVIATHERSGSKGVQVLDLGHYLEALNTIPVGNSNIHKPPLYDRWPMRRSV